MESLTPAGLNGRTMILSYGTKLVAHMATKHKTPYVTISRFSNNNNTWKNAHISMLGLEKLMENKQDVLAAFSKDERYELELTKRQKIIVQIYTGNGKPYLSIVHSKKDSNDADHSRTVVMKKDEFEKMYENMANLMSMLRESRQEAMKAEGAEPQKWKRARVESDMMQAYRYEIQYGGSCETSEKIYLDESSCKAKLDEVSLQLRQNGESVNGSIKEINIPRPNRYMVFEKILLENVQKEMFKMRHERCEGCRIDAPGQMSHMQVNGCISYENEARYSDVSFILHKLGREQLIEKVKKIFSEMSYVGMNNVHIVFDSYMFNGGGIDRICEKINDDNAEENDEQKLIQSFIDKCQ